MSRGVRDLRDLICVSRLTYRDSDEEIFSDNDRLARDFNSLSLSRDYSDSRESSAASIRSATRVSDSGFATGISPEQDSHSLASQPAKEVQNGTKPKTNNRKKRRKKKPPQVRSEVSMGHELPKARPLPPVRSNSVISSSSDEESHDITTPLPRNVPVGRNRMGPNFKAHQKRPRDGKFDDILTYLDANIVAEWLSRANDMVSELSLWCHTGDNFVQFAHFYISDFPDMQRQEILQMEYGIFMDELGLAYAVGRESGKVKYSDLTYLASAVLREYPSKLLSSKGAFLFLDHLDVLSSERAEPYKKLLSDVKVSTGNKQYAQWLLGTRAFALGSLWSAVVGFYRKLLGRDGALSENVPTTAQMRTLTKKDNTQHRLMQAMRHGYIDVMNYFIRTKKISADYCDDHQRTLVHAAVMHNKPKVLQYLLTQLNPAPDVNMPANTGNTPLHAAVNAGNSNMVSILLKQGKAEVNAINKQCDNATPLHMAAMHGHMGIVEMLVNAGADLALRMGDLTVAAIARDFDNLDIAEFIESKAMTN